MKTPFLVQRKSCRNSSFIAFLPLIDFLTLRWSFLLLFFVVGNLVMSFSGLEIFSFLKVVLWPVNYKTPFSPFSLICLDTHIDKRSGIWENYGFDASPNSSCTTRLILTERDKTLVGIIVDVFLSSLQGGPTSFELI